MRIYVPAPQSYAASMKDGMKASLELPEYPDRTFDAAIETTSHAIEKKSRSLLVELIADNKDGALAPGAFARVHFQIPPDPSMMTLPADALLFRDSATEVATLGLDDRIVLKKVRIARDLGSEVEVAGGLSQDERIVANPPDSIGDGEQVRVMQAAAEKAQSPPGEQAAARGLGDHPKRTEEMAQTGRDHDE
jgi:multidrug efflux pump subunit AcrA (membrane-fusion protein)